MWIRRDPYGSRASKVASASVTAPTIPYPPTTFVGRLTGSAKGLSSPPEKYEIRYAS